MDVEFVKYLSTLGVGGVLAGLMFFVYRKDMKQLLAAWEGQTQMLMAVVKDNTAAITALRTEIESQREKAK